RHRVFSSASHAIAGFEYELVAPTPTPTGTPTCTPGGPPGPWTQATPYPIRVARYGFAQTATHFYAFGGLPNGFPVTNSATQLDLTGFHTRWGSLRFGIGCFQWQGIRSGRRYIHWRPSASIRRSHQYVVGWDCGTKPLRACRIQAGGPIPLRRGRIQFES